MVRSSGLVRGNPESGWRVRPAVSGDLGAVLELLRDLYSGGSGAEFNEVRQMRGLQMMLDFPGSQVLVAEQHGDLLGVVTVHLVLSVAEGGWTGVLDNLVVASGHRRRGIGHALLESAVEWFRRQGAVRAQMLADGHNVEAIIFCRKREWLQTNLIALSRIL